MDLPISIPKLEADGSNWLAFRERMVSAMTVRGWKKQLTEVRKNDFWFTDFGTPRAMELMREREADNQRWDRAQEHCYNLLISGIPDSTLVRLRHHNTPSALWSALEAESLTLLARSRVILRAQLDFLKCPKGADAKAHCHKTGVLRERYLLAGGSLSEREFKEKLLSSLPERFLDGFDSDSALLEERYSQHETLFPAAPTRNPGPVIPNLNSANFILDYISSDLGDVLRSERKDRDQPTEYSASTTTVQRHTLQKAVSPIRSSEFASIPRVLPPPEVYAEVYSATTTAHVCPYRELFSSLHPVSPPIRVDVGSGRVFYASERGQVVIVTSSSVFALENVLFVPNMGATLISMTSLSVTHGLLFKGYPAGPLEFYHPADGRTVNIPYNPIMGAWVETRPKTAQAAEDFSVAG